MRPKKLLKRRVCVEITKSVGTATFPTVETVNAEIGAFVEVAATIGVAADVVVATEHSKTVEEALDVVETDQFRDHLLDGAHIAAATAIDTYLKVAAAAIVVVLQHALPPPTRGALGTIHDPDLSPAVKVAAGAVGLVDHLAHLAVETHHEDLRLDTETTASVRGRGNETTTNLATHIDGIRLRPQTLQVQMAAGALHRQRDADCRSL